MITSSGNDKIYKYIRLYEEEAEANLRLYTEGKDTNALQRYNHLIAYVRKLRLSLRSE